MKKSEFKKIIKPIVSECIKESLLEDGIISGIIGEVMKGMTAPSILETKEALPDPGAERMKRNAFDKQQTNKFREQKKKLMSAIGQEAYNGVDLFEGTTPVATQLSPTQQAHPMAGHEPSDPGVDISSLFGSVGKNWNAHMQDVGEGK